MILAVNNKTHPISNITVGNLGFKKLILEYIVPTQTIRHAIGKQQGYGAKDGEDINFLLSDIWQIILITIKANDFDDKTSISGFLGPLFSSIVSFPGYGQKITIMTSSPHDTIRQHDNA